MLSEHIFGTEPFPRLMQLSLSFSQFSDTLNLLPIYSSFIRGHFPRITSLHLEVPWLDRNDAIMMALSQHNLQMLKLIINTACGIEYETRKARSRFPLGVSNDQLHPAILPVALQTLELEVLQVYGEAERSAMWCTQWVFGQVAPFVTGWGGTGLKSIGMWVSRPKSMSVERERVLWGRWIKVSNDGWQMLE